MEDTIVAISTAIGVGAISIIRLSGKDAIEIVNKSFKGKDLTKAQSHTINYGYIINNDEVIDEVLVSITAVLLGIFTANSFRISDIFMLSPSRTNGTFS